MRIKYCVIGSTIEPEYYGFWPIFSDVWKKHFDVIPVLGLITDEESDLYNDGYGLVKKFKIINGISRALQSQLVRLYLPKFLDDITITSDIDMIPLSKKYFIDDVAKYDDNDFIIFSSQHEQTVNLNQYPMCYVAGLPKIFEQMFSLNKNWEEFILGVNTNDGWYSDQVYLYESIHKSGYNRLVYPPREFGSNSRRVDRSYWTYDENLVREGYYIDSHLLRPYYNFKKEIDKLINLL